MKHKLAAFAAALAGLVGLGATPPTYAQAPELAVHVYDIGQGSCVLIECPDDLPILVYCGKMATGGGSIASAARKINTVLDGYRGYYQPLRVILSHADLDHYSLLKERDERGRYLFDPGKVRQVYFGGRFADYGEARGWINAAHRSLSWPKRDYPVDRPCWTNARISCLRPNENAWGAIRAVSCGAAKIDLLTANAQQYYLAHRGDFPGTDWRSDGNKNGDSAVVRVTYGGVSFIVTGDAQEMTEQLALHNARTAGVDLAGAAFLFGSHHGARTHGSNGVEWIRATSPRFAVFSSNLGGGHGHPTCDVVQRFDDEADAAMADAPRGGMSVRCDRSSSPQTFRNRFLVTEATGDITIRVAEDRPPQLGCAKDAPACSWE